MKREKMTLPFFCENTGNLHRALLPHRVCFVIRPRLIEIILLFYHQLWKINIQWLLLWHVCPMQLEGSGYSRKKVLEFDVSFARMAESLHSLLANFSATHWHWQCREKLPPKGNLQCSLHALEWLTHKHMNHVQVSLLSSNCCRESFCCNELWTLFDWFLVLPLEQDFCLWTYRGITSCCWRYPTSESLKL